LATDLKSKQLKRAVLALTFLFLAALTVFWLGRLNDRSTINNLPSEQVGDPVAPSSTATEEQDLSDKTKTTDALPEQVAMVNVEMPDFAAETILVKYENSEDLPDGIAFSVTLLSLTYLHADHPNMALDLIAQEMELEQEEAELFRDRLVEINDAYREEVIAMQYDLLCSGGVAKVYGDDVYSVFHTFDVAKDALAEDYYYALKSELREDQSDKLTQWVDARKLNTTSIRFDYKKRYEQRGRSVDAKAAEMCLNMFEAQK